MLIKKIFDEKPQKFSSWAQCLLVYHGKSLEGSFSLAQFQMVTISFISNHQSQQLIIILPQSTMTSEESRKQLKQILCSSKRLLKAFVSKKSNSQVNMQQECGKLILQLEAFEGASSKIVSSMIASKQKQNKLVRILTRELYKRKREQDIETSLRTVTSEKREEYHFSNTHFPSFVKELTQNISVVEDQLINLENNIQKIIDQSTSTYSLADLPEASLYQLVRLLMQQTDSIVSEEMSQLIFRIYILEQSIHLIFAKVEKVLDVINGQMNDQVQSRRSSTNSQKTGKRSALSHSLEIFKKNQVKQLIQNKSIITCDLDKERQILTEYKMIRNTEKTSKKGNNNGICCFQF